MLSVNRFPGISRYCKLPANHRIWPKVGFLKVSGHLPRLLHGCCTQSTLGRTRTCDLLSCSQDTCVYSSLCLFKNRLSKPASRSRGLQLFIWITLSNLCQNLSPASCDFRLLLAVGTFSAIHLSSRSTVTRGNSPPYRRKLLSKEKLFG